MATKHTQQSKPMSDAEFKKIQRGHRKAEKAETEPDWSGQCEVCGASPIVPLTGMCGTQVFTVTIHVELGYAGRWTTNEVLETVRQGLSGNDGIEAIAAKLVRTVEKPCE